MTQLKKYSNTVMHIGSGCHKPFDKSHSTYSIWTTLAAGFLRYYVFARSNSNTAEWSDCNLTIQLKRSYSKREWVFLWEQFAIVRLGAKLRPDAIVCQSPALGGLAGLLIARICNSGVLLEIHGNEYFAPARWLTRKWFLQKISQYALNHATLIRVLSEGMRSQLLLRYGAHLAERVRILPPRVDVQRFTYNQRTPSPAGRLRIIIVGSVNANKGQLRLISALRKSSIPIDLHIVGEGPDLQSCKSQISTPGLRIICHGHLTHTMLSQLLEQVDVFVMYSASEGTPRAMIEAMATGLPVVTTNAGFCADVIQHDVEGFVLKDKPDNEIIGVLSRLYLEPKLANQMGKCGRERALRDFDASILYERYRALISEVAYK